MNSLTNPPERKAALSLTSYTSIHKSKGNPNENKLSSKADMI
jgi:hypothetical protein